MNNTLSNQNLTAVTYANMAIPQVKRILTLQDRNSFSPTYGSFHRRYWLDKTDDFPDALPQFGVLTLALVYKHNFPNNPYYQNPKILDWAIAGMDFWTTIQHNDGTFDEFYPFERGWAGPTAFTTYAIAEAYKILKEFIPDNLSEKILNACFKAACSIGNRKEAGGILANHHAIAALAIWKTYEIFNEPILISAFEKTWETFLKYHDSDEGWSLEYDGVDPGYLSATVSFLAKIYQTNKSPEIFEVINKSVNFCSYFVYPNNFYAGSIGSRNTLHFYPHGFEILSKEIPIAGSISERMLTGLGEGKLVPPEIMADRYVFYRVPEFLQSYLDYKPKDINLPLLPFERKSFKKYFVKSSIYSEKISDHYIIANLSKGGVIKLFQSDNGELILNDCGIIGKLSNGQVTTSQWIGENYQKNIHADGWEVSGKMKFIPSNKYFTPFKTIIFRIILLTLGWNTNLAHIIKGTIRNLLMLKAKDAPIHFHRHCKIDETKIVLTDQVQLIGKVSCTKLSIGDEFFVRYVPQSRYFQSQELQIAAIELPKSQLNDLNMGKKIIIKREVSLNALNPVKISFKTLLKIT